MSTEVAVLGYAGLLAVLHLVVLAIAANLTMSSRWLTGPRDSPRDLPALVGRLKRAFDNHIEGLVMFTAAVAVVEFGEGRSWLTATAAQVYLAARLLYGPAYVSGLPWIRSVIWIFGFTATIVMLIAALAAG